MKKLVVNSEKLVDFLEKLVNFSENIFYFDVYKWLQWFFVTPFLWNILKK